MPLHVEVVADGVSSVRKIVI